MARAQLRGVVLRYDEIAQVNEIYAKVRKGIAAQRYNADQQTLEQFKSESLHSLDIVTQSWLKTTDPLTLDMVLRGSEFKHHGNYPDFKAELQDFKMKVYRRAFDELAVRKLRMQKLNRKLFWISVVITLVVFIGYRWTNTPFFL